jgi:hypothetical protein
VDVYVALPTDALSFHLFEFRFAPAKLLRQLLQQRLRLLQIARVEALRKPPVNLSITHNSCADRGAQPDIGETGQAAPHHDVPRRRIIGAREVSA